MGSTVRVQSDSASHDRSMLQRYWFDVPLWKRIVPAFILGVSAGLVFGEGAIQFHWIGDIFVRLARMLGV